MADQAKLGNEASEGKASLCRDCGEKPTISPRSPYCSSCMQKKAIAARMNKPKASKRKEGGGPAAWPIPHLKETSKAGTVVMPVDFGRHREVLEAIVKLAEEEMRPLDVQIIYMLKGCLKRPGADAFMRP